MIRLCLAPAAIGGLLVTAGCQTLMRSVGMDTGAAESNQEAVRGLLASGQYEAALERIGPDGDAAPTDAALWLLYQGSVAHQAGRYEESAEAFDLAHYVSEARYTRRLGTGLASLITNDRVLPYVPDRTERLLIHYYAALSYLMLDQADEAAVEARRLSFMLARYAEDPPLRDHPALVSHLRLVAGLVFEAAGEMNDAAVAYRLAYEAAGRPGAGPLAFALAAASSGGVTFASDAQLDDVLPALVPGGHASALDSTGEVIVLIERGFIAPRVEETVELALWEHELEAVGIAGAISRAGTATCIADWVTRSSGPLYLDPRIDTGDDEMERCVPVPDDWDERQRPPVTAVRGALEPPAPRNMGEVVRGPADPGADPDADGVPPHAQRPAGPSPSTSEPERKYVTLALPGYPIRAAGLTPVASNAVLRVDGLDPVDVSLPIDLSSCVMDEFAADATFVLAKTIARVAARAAIARGLSEKSGDAEVLGDVLGFLVEAAGDAMERADTRSWSLLPASLGVVRMRLPAGAHAIALSPDDDVGSAACDLGTVRVEPGRTAILSCRIWD